MFLEFAIEKIDAYIIALEITRHRHPEQSWSEDKTKEHIRKLILLHTHIKKLLQDITQLGLDKPRFSQNKFLKKIEELRGVHLNDTLSFLYELHLLLSKSPKESGLQDFQASTPYSENDLISLAGFLLGTIAAVTILALAMLSFKILLMTTLIALGCTYLYVITTVNNNPAVFALLALATPTVAAFWAGLSVEILMPALGAALVTIGFVAAINLSYKHSRNVATMIQSHSQIDHDYQNLVESQMSAPAKFSLFYRENRDLFRTIEMQLPGPLNIR
ncbi:MAG: hypothetical protein CK424_02390 [Legionella sp.]|nr:MAG: hypothetical protein CK424_02390 [Legionella sp.]